MLSNSCHALSILAPTHIHIYIYSQYIHTLTVGCLLRCIFIANSLHYSTLQRNFPFLFLYFYSRTVFLFRFAIQKASTSVQTQAHTKICMCMYYSAHLCDGSLVGHLGTTSSQSTLQRYIAREILYQRHKNAICCLICLFIYLFACFVVGGTFVVRLVNVLLYNCSSLERVCVEGVSMTIVLTLIHPLRASCVGISHIRSALESVKCHSQ